MFLNIIQNKHLHNVALQRSSCVSSDVISSLHELIRSELLSPHTFRPAQIQTDHIYFIKLWLLINSKQVEERSVRGVCTDQRVGEALPVSCTAQFVKEELYLFIQSI